MTEDQPAVGLLALLRRHEQGLDLDPAQLEAESADLGLESGQDVIQLLEFLRILRESSPRPATIPVEVDRRMVQLLHRLLTADEVPVSKDLLASILLRSLREASFRRALTAGPEILQEEYGLRLQPEQWKHLVDLLRPSFTEPAPPDEDALEERIAAILLKFMSRL